MATRGSPSAAPPPEDDRRREYPAACTQVGILVVLTQAVVIDHKVQGHRHEEQEEVLEAGGIPVEEQVADEEVLDGER